MRLRCSWRIVAKRKVLNPKLNCVGSIYVNKALEEDIDSAKEIVTFKEAINSLCKKEFIVVIEKEVLNYTKRNY